MKLKYLYIFMFVATGLWVGCSDNPEEESGSIPEPPVPPTPPAQTYRVGDFYNQGFIKGVVIRVNKDGTEGTVVSLDEIKTVWSYKDEEPTSSRPESGRYNTDHVYGMENWRENYPGFKWCSEKDLMAVKKWYIPNRQEIEHLYMAYSGAAVNPGPTAFPMDSRDLTSEEILQNKQKFNATLKNNGGTPIVDESYWTSSEFSADMAYAFDMKEGIVIEMPQVLGKRMEYRFRAMADFKL